MDVLVDDSQANGRQENGTGRVTREEIARRAGVSTATVSYVLNEGPRPVSGSARAAVLRAAHELGYSNTRRHRRPPRRRRRVIGFLVPDLLNPILASLAFRLEELCSEAGYAFAVATSDGQPERTEARLALLHENRVDGLLVLATHIHESNLRRFAADEIPVTLLQYPIDGFSADTVQVDSTDIGRQATEHLLEHGHTAIGCVAGPGGAPRIQGYREALLLRGLPVTAALIESTDSKVEDGRAAASKILAGPDRPSAIFATNGLLAAGTLRAARDHGLRVPEDLAVVAADESFIATITSPTITTVGLPAVELARLGVGMLVDRMRGAAEPTPRRLTLRGNLVQRESCGCSDRPSARYGVS